MPRRLQKDVDVARLQLTARDGKGGKERVTVLPTSLVEPLARQLERARALRELNLREGFGRVYLPHALDRKYPNANREWLRQYVFPARHRSADSRSGHEQSVTTSQGLRYRRRSSGRSWRPVWPRPGAATPSANLSPLT